MPKNKRNNRLSVALLSLLVGTGTALADVGNDLSSVNKSIEDALKIGADGGVKVDLRYRYENVNQDNTLNTTTRLPLATQPHTANANTIRTKFGILTPTFFGIQGYVEYAGNHVLQSDYNNGLGNKTWLSTVNDPSVNRLNQLWLSYSGIPDTTIKGGRQVIKLDDDRFIGNVPWRQTEIVYDSVLVTNKSIKNLTAKVGYIGSANTVLATTDHMNTPLINLKYNFGDYGHLIGYGYWIGYTKPPAVSSNPATAANRSNQTYGIRYTNADKPVTFFDHYGLLYTAEWAIQKDYLNSPVKYEAHRYNLMAGVNAFNMVDIKGGFEQMDGHGANQAFVTPLSSAHGINGWSDVLATTPAYGMRRWYASVVGSFLEDKSLEVTGVFHDFSSSAGKQNYGKEWDFQVMKKFGPHYSLLAKYAYFDAAPNANFSANATNTQKIWVQGGINF